MSGALSAPGVPAEPRARSAAANSLWQLLTFGARAVAGLAVVVLLARTEGPRALGVYQFAVVLTAMLPYYYGLPSLLAREVARRPHAARQWVEASLLVALTCGALFTGLLAAGAALLDTAPEMVLALVVASVGMAFDGVARVHFAAFWAWERMDLEAAVTVVQELAYLLATTAVLLTGGSAQQALVVFAASRALGAVLSWLVVGRHLHALPVPRAGRRFLTDTVRRATPFMASDTLTLAYMRTDSVLLGVMRGPAAVGLYQAATNLVLYFNVVARSLNKPLYPRMGRAWPDWPDEFRRVCEMSFASIHLFAVPITVGSLLLAPRTFDVLYGPSFAPALLTYQLLVLVIPVRMLGHTLSMTLSATDRQSRRTAAVAGAAALNLGLNLYAIPRWSYLGAAVTTIVCEVLLLAVYALLQRSVAGGAPLLRTAAVPVAASIPMAGVLLVTGELHLLLAVLLGGTTYVGAVVVLALLRAPRSEQRRPRTALVRLVRAER